MKILKWNIDKEKGFFGYKINRAIPVDVISYETLYGDKVKTTAKKVRKSPIFEVKFGRIVSKVDLK